MQTSLLDTNANNSLQIDTEVRKNLRVTARWSIFLAIISFIFYGLILAVIIGLITLGPSYVGPINIEAATIKVLIIYLVIIVISMIPFVAMFRFSRSTKAALTSDSQGNEEYEDYFSILWNNDGYYHSYVRHCYHLYFDNRC